MKSPEPSMSSNTLVSHQPRTLGAALPSHGALEVLKWLALLAMGVDHVGTLVFEQGKFSISYEAGRLAYPLFAMVLACRLADRAHRLGRLDAAPVWRLLRWALVSVLPFFWATGRLWPLDIFFTLAVGAGLCWLADAPCRPAPRIAVHLVAALASFACDYMAPGVYLILATYSLHRRSKCGGAAFGMLLCAVGLCLVNGSFTCLLAFFLMSCAHLNFLAQVAVPRMPGLFFYAFYPLHLCVLAAWRHFH